MYNQEEIKKAIELVKLAYPYSSKYKGLKEDEALQLLLDLAQQVINVKISQQDEIADMLIPYMRDNERFAISDKILYDFRFWQATCLGKLENELMKDLAYLLGSKRYGIKFNYKSIHNIAQAIRNLFVVSKKGE